MVGVVHDGGRRGRAEALLGQAAPVPLLARQHALLALPLVQIVPRLRKVHVQPARVLLVRAGAQPDAVPCGEGGWSVGHGVTWGSQAKGAQGLALMGTGKKSC